MTENTRVIENKHILAYVSGLGFGIISGLFAMDNLLADMVSLFILLRVEFVIKNFVNFTVGTWYNGFE